MKNPKRVILVALIAMGMWALSSCSSSRRMGCPMKITHVSSATHSKNC